MFEMLLSAIRFRYLVIIFVCEMILQCTTTTQGSTTSRQDFDNENKPNIIMIVADDLGFNDVPWHNEEVVAPNLQNLAEEGIILEQSYVQPRCTPTRSAIMSGIYPFATGRQENVILASQPTGLTLSVSLLPEYLKPLGYETHAIGKWHLGFCKWEYTPTERGFDTFTGFYNGNEDYYTHEVDSNGYDFRENRRVFREASGNYSTYEFAARVETILHSGDLKVPKYLYVAFQSVHTPLEVPEIYTEPYAHIEHEERRTYLGMVSAMDEAIGRIIRALKETGHYDNSVIVFTTDNGGSLVGGNNWPLRGCKRTLWEGGTRGVAFIHSPLLPNPGRIVNNLIHATDWLATFITIAGGIPPKGTDSISQWEALRGEAPPPRKELVYDIASRDSAIKAAIRVGDYKLLVGDQETDEWTSLYLMRTKSISRNIERRQTKWDITQQTILNFNSSEDFFKLDVRLRLYNITNDPEERINLASSEKETTLALLERLLSFKPRYLEQDINDEDDRANPKFWGGVWSPGWC